MSFKNNKHDHPDRSPGPGNYNLLQMNIDGKYPISTFRNATSIVFGVSKEPRFNYKCNYNLIHITMNIFNIITTYLLNI